MCLTANPTLEWAGSTVQVPVGIRLVVRSAMADLQARCDRLDRSYWDRPFAGAVTVSTTVIVQLGDRRLHRSREEKT